MRSPNVPTAALHRTHRGLYILYILCDLHKPDGALREARGRGHRQSLRPEFGASERDGSPECRLGQDKAITILNRRCERLPERDVRLGREPLEHRDDRLVLEVRGSPVVPD